MGILSERTLRTPIGGLRLVATEAALVRVLFEDTPRGAGNAGRRHPVLDRAARELEAYFSGERAAFATPTSAEGTGFQRDVWEALARIAYGATETYTGVARAIGRPLACRAVGMANHRNPLPILVPCHRVIGADGSLTGYGGGMERKRWLLAHEARHAGPPRVVQRTTTSAIVRG